MVSIDEPSDLNKEGNQITFNDVLGSTDEEVIDEVSVKYNNCKAV
jgi:hypothetical protein